MRHLSQKEAQNERDFFSKKKNGKFTLINHRDFIQYPQLFMVTGHDDFQSGSLGITRNKHTTHIKVKVSGPAGINIGVRFVGGHYHKGKNTEDFVFNIPTNEGENEVLVRIHPKDYSVIFYLDLPLDVITEEEEGQIKVEGEFDFVEQKRFMFFSRLLNPYF